MEEVITGCFHSWSDDVPAMFWSHRTQRLAHWWSSEAVDPTGPSWCNCSTSIADSPGAKQHCGLMQSAEQPFVDQGQLKDDSASVYWRQQTGLDVKVEDDAFVAQLKHRTSSIEGIRSRQAVAMWGDNGEHLWCYERLTTEQAANNVATFFSDKVASVWTSTAATPCLKFLAERTIAEWMDRARSVFSMSRFLRTLALTCMWPTSVLA